MTLTDLLLTGLLVYFVWNGFRTGFVMQIVGFAGALAAYWGAKTYSPAVTPWVEKMLGKTSLPSQADQWNSMGIGTRLVQGILQNGYEVIAFAIVFAVGLLAVRLAGHMLHLVVSLPGLSLFNRLAGLFAGAVVGVLILVVLVNIGSLLPSVTIQKALQSSQIAAVLLKTDLSRLLFSW